MTSKTFFVIGSFVTLIIAILLVSYRINAEKKIIKLFERNVNRSLCTLCLGNTASCNTLDFKLDYKRHADLRQDSNYLFMFLIVIKRLFEYWTSRQNDKIFFGYIKLNNIVVPTIAKSPGHYCSEHFERIVNITSGIDTITINNQWNLLPFSLDSRSLVLCSTDNTQSSSLLHNFFNSFRQYSYNTSNNFQSLVELWVSAHLNVELLVLKVSKLIKCFFNKAHNSINVNNFYILRCYMDIVMYQIYMVSAVGYILLKTVVTPYNTI